MTDNERNFLELVLRVWLEKLKQEKASSASQISQNSWFHELVDTAKEYLCDIAYSDQEGYVLTNEKSRLIAELQQAVIEAKVNEKLYQALFVDMDIEKVKSLAYGLRNQVETIMMEYKSHI